MVKFELTYEEETYFFSTRFYERIHRAKIVFSLVDEVDWSWTKKLVACRSPLHVGNDGKERREGKRGRTVGEQEKQRTLVESFVQTEGTSMCVTFAASKRPCTRLFSFHRASLTSLSFDVSILSFSLGYASFFFFFFFFLLFLEMYSEAIHRKVTDKKFRIFIVTLVFCTKESWTRIHQSFESGLRISKFANFSKRWQYYGVSIPLIKTGYRSRSAR